MKNHCPYFNSINMHDSRPIKSDLLDASLRLTFKQLAETMKEFKLPFSFKKPVDLGNSNNPLVSEHEKIIYSACLVNCGSRCPLKVHVKNDIITKIASEDGQNDSIFAQHQIKACLRGRAVRYRTYDPERLKYPMLRIGKRGEGKFKRISWQQALHLLAEKLTYTIQTYGNEAIYYQYGSGTLGANISGRHACKRFLSSIGGYLNYHGDYSNAQIQAIRPYIYGNAKDSLLDQIKHSDLVIMFGHNVAETRMSGGGQVTEVFQALEQSQAKVIIIDPRYTESMVAYNATWLPIIPGTDAALVAGLVYALLEEDRIDEAMLNQYCVGWSAETLPDSAPANSDYKSYILGLGCDLIRKTPEWAAHKTGIPADQIRSLALEIVNAKAAWISQGYGPQRSQNGEHTARAIMLLPIITGQFGKAGTNIGTWGGSVTYYVPNLAMANPVKTSIPFFLWTKAIVDAPNMTAKNAYVKGKEKLDVGIKFIWNYAGNVLANQHSDLNQTHQILQDESQCEFILVWDTHMTSSAKYADLLLPDASSVENSDLINNSYSSGAYHYLIRMQQAIKPLWENRQTYDVLAELSTMMGVADKFTEGRSQEDWIKHCYETLRQLNFHLPDYDKTDGMGVIDRKIANSDEHIALKQFRDDPKRYPLTTPSGKIEIYSQDLVDVANQWQFDEQDILYPIPAYLPAIEGSEDSKQLAKYPLQLIGFHTKGQCHSSYSNLQPLREAVVNSMWINPVDAKVRNIEHDHWVEVFNERGKLRIKAKVTARILPGVIAIPEGMWTNLDSKGIDIGGNINRLTSLRPTVLAKANPQHTNLVDVRAFKTDALIK